MKISRLLILIGTLAILTFGLTAIIFNGYKVLDVKSVNMSVTVTSEIGFAATNESLNFGTVVPGAGSSSRFVQVGNQRDTPVLVRIVGSGSMKKWLQINPHSVLLQPNETQMISFAVVAPDDVAYGNYTGKAKFIYERP